MDEVPGAKLLGCQSLRIRHGPLRPIGSLHRVDVIVDGAEMVRIGGEHALERLHDLRRAAIRRLAGVGPVVPR
jgi:hypothetical protein